MRNNAVAKSSVVVVAAALAVFAIGVVIAIVGNLMRHTICIGGGSECTGAKPIWHSGGTVLYYAGAVVALSAPLVATAVWWRLRLRGRATP